MNWATVTHQQVWLALVGAVPFLLGAPAECKCAEIGRKAVLGAKPRNHIRPELRAAGQVTETVPEGQAAPAARHCFMRLAVTWQHPASSSRRRVPAPLLRQGPKSDCKGHPGASCTRHRNKAGKGCTHGCRP